MSLEAMRWALATPLPEPVDDAISRLVLIILGEDSDEIGKGAALTVAQITAKARCSTRAVRAKLKDLESAGLLSRGDQTLATAIQANYRPVVWDLAMTPAAAPGHRPRGAPSAPPAVQDVHPSGCQGCSRCTPRGAGDAPLRTRDLFPEPPEIPPPSLRSGGAARAQAHTRETGPPAKRGTRLPPDWKPDSELAQWTLDEGMSRETARHTLEDFRDYWCAKAGKDAEKVEWPRVWKRWVREELRREQDRYSSRRPRPAGRPTTLNDILDDIDGPADGNGQHNGLHITDLRVIDGELVMDGEVIP